MGKPSPSDVVTLSYARAGLPVRLDPAWQVAVIRKPAMPLLAVQRKASLPLSVSPMPTTVEPSDETS
mgnify:CR=1 FL=1